MHRDLNGHCQEISTTGFFHESVSPKPGPEYPIRVVSNFFENSRRDSQLKVHHHTIKKSFSIFPSQAGMSLTELSLGGNNDVICKLFPPRESLVSDIPFLDGNIESFFYGAVSLEKIFHQKSFRYFVFTPLGSRVNIYIIIFSSSSPLKCNQSDIVPIISQQCCLRTWWQICHQY